MKTLAANVMLASCPILICKFAEDQYATCFPRSSNIFEWDGDVFVPLPEDHSLFRGDPATDDFYHSLEDLRKNALVAHFGGPDGDLDTASTDGRYYEVLGVLLLSHLEDDE